MVMEYLDHELKMMMEDMVSTRFSVSEVKLILSQLLQGVAYLHDNWVIHRDLKTSNLLLKNGVLKICDFGMARYFSEPLEKLTPNVVTLWYRAPELLLGEDVYSTAMDMVCT
jgi:cell division cycle 2-like